MNLLNKIPTWVKVFCIVALIAISFVIGRNSVHKQSTIIAPQSNNSKLKTEMVGITVNEQGIAELLDNCEVESFFEGLYPATWVNLKRNNTVSVTVVRSDNLNELISTAEQKCGHSIPYTYEELPEE